MSFSTDPDSFCEISALEESQPSHILRRDNAFKLLTHALAFVGFSSTIPLSAKGITQDQTHTYSGSQIVPSLHFQRTKETWLRMHSVVTRDGDLRRLILYLHQWHSRCASREQKIGATFALST